MKASSKYPHDIATRSESHILKREEPDRCVSGRDVLAPEPLSVIAFESNRDATREMPFSTLDAAAHFMQENASITLEIQGYTDSRGSGGYNQQLSQRRAEAVQAYLEERGIAPSRLTARGFGEPEPAVSNRTSRGRAVHRRVELFRTDTGTDD
ncbi:MAG: OmpA family protein [Myxococcota bacterium]